jgi:hypothetical protein
MLAAPALCAQSTDAAGQAVLRSFEASVDAYVQVHRRVEGPIPPLQASNDMGEVRRLMTRVRDGIRRERGERAQGVIFTPEVVAFFRREIGGCLGPDELAAIQEDFAEHSPVPLGTLRMHQPLPQDTPFSPLPARLLATLPHLPPELRYVVFAKALVLWDHHADMVVDIAAGVLDPASYRTTGKAVSLRGLE